MPVLSRLDINAMPAQAIAKYTIISGSDPVCHAEIEEVLKQHLRHELVKQAQRRLPTTYGRLAKMVTVSSLGEIRIIGKSLEHLMQEDVYHDRPLVAALAVSSFGRGLPASWFFRKARDLGKFVGHCEGVEAYAFHTTELQRAISYYWLPYARGREETSCQ
ncbi:hypothetical protein N8E89_23025 (plasmid) [Phyllobacterium sp. A18/5-2]|uniref:hypothetical protein n=1 Tax=Phyllobacterium sp. A18/5-2 TaxID=2978392 RepID=UPI0021C75B97|nr:hypothetical protein [Phyllobacterium sp. A18/5-2]UXN66092.1 hypothetical protein N8E89_23025 [Phyllobacterium sp. A18/5-2]